MARIEDIRRAYTEAWRDGVRDVAREVLDRGNEVIAKEAIDQGDLLHSGEVEEAPVRVEAAAKWSSRHSVWVHNGTRKAAGHPMGRMPPLEPFIGWVKRNMTIVGAVGVFKALPGRGGRRPRKEEVVAVAEAVRMKVWREGTKGVFYGTRAAAEVRFRAPRLMQDAVDRRLRQL